MTYSIEEVAAILGLSRNSAYVAAREDRLPVPVMMVSTGFWAIARQTTSCSDAGNCALPPAT
jgi:hypothetical protein